MPQHSFCTWPKKQNLNTQIINNIKCAVKIFTCFGLSLFFLTDESSPDLENNSSQTLASSSMWTYAIDHMTFVSYHLKGEDTLRILQANSYYTPYMYMYIREGKVREREAICPLANKMV